MDFHGISWVTFHQITCISAGCTGCSPAEFCRAVTQADHGLVYCTLHDLHRAKAGFAGAFEGWKFHHSYGKANSERLEKSKNLKIESVGKWNIAYNYMLHPCVPSFICLNFDFPSIPSSTTWYTKTRNRSSADIRLPPLLGLPSCDIGGPALLYHLLGLSSRIHPNSLKS